MDLETVKNNKDTDVTKKVNTESKEPHYVAKTQNGWGVGMIGLDADDGSFVDHAGIIGLPMLGFKIECDGISKARVRNRRGKWLPYDIGFDSDLGDGTNITGIELVGAGYTFSVHVMGGQWMNAVHTSDIEGAAMFTSGSTIDAIWINKI